MAHGVKALVHEVSRLLVRQCVTVCRWSSRTHHYLLHISSASWKQRCLLNWTELNRTKHTGCAKKFYYPPPMLQWEESTPLCRREGKGQCGILRRKSAANARWRLQTVASIWIRISARRRSCAHGPSDAGLVDGKLYRLHHKGPMATKFTRPQPTWLPRVGRNASGISQTLLKAKDHSNFQS